MGQIADPLTVKCPGCGADSSHPVASLRSLSAECPSCRHSLRENGERVIAMEREIAIGVMAMGIILAIEDLNDDIKFEGRDFQYESLVCLNDIIALVDKAIGDLPASDRPSSGFEIVKQALEAMLPSIELPVRQMPLVDAFGGRWREMEDWHWRKPSAPKTRQIDR